jgi:hypothetical protein
MNLPVCPECRHPVSPKAPQCPNCGFRYPTVRPAARPNLPLLSATSPGVPAVRCRECQTEFRGRMAICPVCGARNPVAGPFHWRTVGTVLVLLALASGAWWWYDRSLRSGDRDAVFVRSAPPPPSQVPKVKAFGFTTRCATPAPVYIFDAGTLPESFIVILASRGDDPVKVTKALAEKYDLRTGGYEPAKRGFAAGLSHALVARLRCEPSVESLEEDPATRFNRDGKGP